MDRREFVLSSCTALLIGECKPTQSSPTLRISMIPTTDPGKIVRQSQPLVDYLQKQTGAKIELTVPTSYAAVVEAITSNKVDIGYLGGFTYLQASSRGDIRPLVQRLQDKSFHSLFITQAGSSIHSMADLTGKTFAFGDINSTSGHLMPSYYMRQEKVDPAVIDKAIFTGGHDATALAVANKRVDAGAMDELVYKTMMQKGAVTPAQIRVFYTTPPFFDYVWVARSGLDPALADKFTQALLQLDEANPQDKTLLDLLNAHKYARANASDHTVLRQAATNDGLLQ